MKTQDLVNKIAASNNITPGRSEMIIDLIIEKMTLELKSKGEVTILNFGTFRVRSKRPEGVIFPGTASQNTVIYEPIKRFLEILNDQ